MIFIGRISGSPVLHGVQSADPARAGEARGNRSHPRGLRGRRHCRGPDCQVPTATSYISMKFDGKLFLLNFDNYLFLVLSTEPIFLFQYITFTVFTSFSRYLRLMSLYWGCPQFKLSLPNNDQSTMTEENRAILFKLKIYTPTFILGLSGPRLWELLEQRKAWTWCPSVELTTYSTTTTNPTRRRWSNTSAQDCNMINTQYTSFLRISTQYNREHAKRL